MSKKKKISVKKIKKRFNWKKLFFFFSGTAVILLTLSVGLLHKQVSVLGTATSSLNVFTVRNLTSQMLSSTTPLNQRISLAQQRKALMQSLLSDPKTFLATAMTPQQRAQLPPSIQPYIEQQVSIKGRITVFHADNIIKDTEIEKPILLDDST